MNNIFLEEIARLRHFPAVNPTVLDRFEQRIKDGRGLTRDEGPTDHVCSFFLPINRQERKIYVGHHIKANSWIPPGGHIDKGETPIQAIVRECMEELQYVIKPEQIELYDTTIIDIARKTQSCTRHYDFWYLVNVPVIDFLFDTKEFYDATWIDIAKAVTMVTHPVYLPVITRLANEFGQL